MTLTAVFNRACIAARRIRIPITPFGWTCIAVLAGAVIIGALGHHLKGN